MEYFPAVAIGGPPHSGKSVFTYSLTQALRDRGVDHYVLRACPDGEGDWANQASQALVRRIRYKGPWTAEWIDRICRDISHRHLPLIVDIGGQPTAYQERVFDCCTHAVLLTPDEPSRLDWRQCLARHGLPLLADLRSRLDGQDVVTAAAPELQGVISGLRRGAAATGPAFDAVVDRLAALFARDAETLRRDHLAQAPVELAIDLDRLAWTLGIAARGTRVIWLPEHLPALLDYLPAATPLGFYGRGPNWLYAAGAALASPAPFAQFDVRMGWVHAQILQTGIPDARAPLQFRVEHTAGFVHLEGHLPSSYIDYRELADVRVPALPADTGSVLSGKLPQWVYTSLVCTYRQAPWLAVYQPQLPQPVIVASRSPEKEIGAYLCN